MELGDQETIILINQEDVREGYFKFSTSRRIDFERLCRRIGESNLLLVHMMKDRIAGKPVYWECHVPIRFLSKTTFAIGKPRNVSEAQKLAASKLAASHGFAKKKAADA